jgi:uncharacterized protein
MYYLFTGLLIGVVFGFAFEKSKVFEAFSIIGQLLFKRFTMLKVLMTAMVTSMLVLGIMQQLGVFEFKLKELNLFSNILGGGVLGVGIALSGACPGTVFAQIGVGYKDAIFTFLGGLLAAFVYSFWNCSISDFFSQWSIGKISLTDVLGVSQFSLTLGIAVLFVVFLIGLERFRSWRVDVLEQ